MSSVSGVTGVESVSVRAEETAVDQGAEARECSAAVSGATVPSEDVVEARRALGSSATADAGGAPPCSSPLVLERPQLPSFRIAPGPAGLGGKLTANIDGRDVTLAEDAVKAWVLARGRFIAWSAPDGAGGFENEGQALYVYDVQARATRKVAAEYFMIESARTLDRGSLVALTMQDGGLGASHLAIVHADRGLVYHAPLARIVAICGDEVTVAHYDASAYESGPAPVGTPKKLEKLSLSALRDAPILVLERPDDAVTL